jgi:hypothetical protein
MLSFIRRGLQKADANAGKQAKEADKEYTYENRTVPTQCEEDLVIDTQLNRCVFKEC